MAQTLHFLHVIAADTEKCVLAMYHLVVSSTAKEGSVFARTGLTRHSLHDYVRS